MSPTTPPAPPARKKPSVLASCILLVLILGALGAVAGGGFWAYKTYVAKPAQKTPSVATSKDPKIPATPSTDVKRPPKPSVLESPVKPSTDPTAGVTPSTPTPNSNTVASQTPNTPTPPVPPTDPPTSPAKSDTPPANGIATNELNPNVPTEPLPDPAVDAAAAAEPGPVVAAEPIETFPETDPQVGALKADADRRIDEAPAELYSDADKQRVREAIRKAKRLTRVATLQFGVGASALGSNERNRLKKALLSPEAEALLSDPQAVFFILGFADATGATDLNRKISQKRAAGVADVLKSFKVTNSSYAVGIGATTLVSAEQQSKNRAAEVWLVLP